MVSRIRPTQKMPQKDFWVNSVNIFRWCFLRNLLYQIIKQQINKSRILTTETHITASVISVLFRKNVMRYAFCCFHNNSF